MAAPGAPQSVQASAGYGMAFVTWQPSSDTTDVPTSYTVTSNHGDTITVTTPPGAQWPPLQGIFPVLTNGTSYTFTVVATNGSGSSPASAASNSVTPNPLAPLTPSIATVTTRIIAQLAYDMTVNGVGNPPEMWFGEENLGARSYAPRIIFVPGKAVGNQWKGRGSRHFGNTVTTAKQIGERQQELEAWVWGAAVPSGDANRDAMANYAVAEQLANFLTASVKHVVNGMQLPESFSFPKTDGENLAAGCAIALRFRIALPMTDYPPISVSLTSVPFTVVVLQPLLLTPSSATATTSGPTITFVATRGSGGPYVYSLSVDSTGGSIDASTGTYTPGSVIGTDIVQVVDSAGNIATAPVVVTLPITVTPSSVTLGAGDTQQFVPTGGSGNYVAWAITNDPAYGTIDQSGNYTAGDANGADTVQVTDSLGNTGTATVTVDALSPVAVSPLNPGVQVGGGTQTFTATGGTGMGFTWLITVNQSGGNIDPDSGFYTAGNSIGHDTVQATDSGGHHGTSVVNVFAA